MTDSRRTIAILPVIALTSFMGTFLISSVNIALPAIGRDFELSPVMLSWVVTSFLLSTALFLLPVGLWADRTGVKKVYQYGLLIFTITTFLIPLSATGTWLVVLRFVQGIGAAFMNTTGQAILVAAYPPQRRGRVLGISVSATYMGLAMGPFVGGYLTQYAGWTTIFWVSGVLGVAANLFSFRYLGTDPKDVHTSAPVFDIRMFTHNRLFAYSNLAALINYTATTAIVFYLSFYLQQVQGFVPRVAGLILVAQPLMMSLFSPLVGRLSDKVQPRYLATAGMAMCSLGLVAFSFLSETTPIAIVVAILIWEGIGFALFSSPNMNTIMSSVEKRNLAIASGTAASMRVVGQIVSMSVVTVLFSVIFGEKLMHEVTNLQFLKAMKWGFSIFAALGVAGIYFSIRRNHSPLITHH